MVLRLSVTQMFVFELQQISNNSIQVGNDEPETLFEYLVNHHDSKSFKYKKNCLRLQVHTMGPNFQIVN